MKSHLDYHQSNILIYGATGGIGQALCHELKGRGANLYLLGRDEVKLNALAAELELEPSHLYVANSLKESFRNVQEWLLGLEVTFQVGIHAAGKGVFGRVNNISAEEIREVMEVNLLSAFDFYQLFEALPKTKQWELAYMGSYSTMQPWPKNALYGASKAGLKYFCQSLQKEVRAMGGRVWHFEAGSVNTAFFDQTKNHLPKEKMIQPKALANFIAGQFQLDPHVYYATVPLVSTE